MIQKKFCLIGIVLAALMLVSVCGCLTPQPQSVPLAPENVSIKPTTVTTHVTAKASVIPSVTPSVAPSATPSPTATPTQTTLSISGPTTMIEGGGGVWIVYINGQLPTASQSNQIVWNSGGLPGGEVTATGHPLGPSGPYGSWVIDANGAATTAQGTHTLVATYQGVSASYTITRLPNSNTATPTVGTVQTGLEVIMSASGPGGNIIYINQTATGTITINPASASSEGTPTATIDGSAYPAVTITPSSIGSWSISFNPSDLSVGQHELVVVYPSNSHYLSSDMAVVLNVV
jgi:hypothetical protein